MNDFSALARRNRAGEPCALACVCSAHEDVLIASLGLARETGHPIVIEATSNQVNQFGGYTGMTPRDFVERVREIAFRIGTDPDLLRFGGDHLGPQAWKGEAPAQAMDKARVMVRAYVEAGFAKIHLDCSEGCAGEAAQVDDATGAARAVALARTCEEHAPDPSRLAYVIGTEVPPPGGVRVSDAHDGIVPTSPGRARTTLGVYERAFEAAGLGQAWQRVVGLVVQPGLEFGPSGIDRFDIDSPDPLSEALRQAPHVCFEAHSTDYQHAPVYRELARRHFAFLKVGPALTFAYRQALYSLDHLRRWYRADGEDRPDLPALMEQLMREQPGHWRNHYDGEGGALVRQLHFGHADRIRYYWPERRARAAVADLMRDLSSLRVADPVVEQYFPPEVIERGKALESAEVGWPKALVHARIQAALRPYLF